MSERDLAERLDAVERTLTDDDTDLSAVQDAAALSADVDRLETRIDELEATVDELEAAVEAVRGYAGNVRAVNREVERRASAALAKAETIETAVDGTDTALTDRRAEAGRGRQPSAVASGPDASDRDASTADGGGRSPAGPGDTVGTGATRADDADPTLDPTGPNAPAVPTSDRRSGGDGRRRRRGNRGADANGHGNRPDPPSTGATTASRDAPSSQTEAFIERVRDAL